MLYLEDYLEMIEQLPQDLRDRLTDMREMDLSVQNTSDRMDDKVKKFFESCKKQKDECQDEQYSQIQQEYYKLLEEADEKVQLANQLYELVERYVRKLNLELQKFKLELEADNAGITEALEKKVRELDQQPPPAPNHKRAEKRKLQETKSYEVLHSSLQEALSQEPIAAVPARPSHSFPPARTPAACSFYEDQIGRGSSNVIAEAASQAIAATQQMQQGRRTASLKASYEATKTKEIEKLSIGRDFIEIPRPQRQKQKYKFKPDLMTYLDPDNHRPPLPAPKTASFSLSHRQKFEEPQTPSDDTIIDDQSSKSDWAVDPTEPRYCICNDVSYGDMVACDNQDCPIEWFHYGCVGLQQAPKGKWYCPQCNAAMKRRKSTTKIPLP